MDKRNECHWYNTSRCLTSRISIPCHLECLLVLNEINSRFHHKTTNKRVNVDLQPRR